MLTSRLEPNLEASSTDTQPASSSNRARSQGCSRLELCSELLAVKGEGEGTRWLRCHQVPPVRHEGSGEEPLSRQEHKSITRVARLSEKSEQLRISHDVKGCVKGRTSAHVTVGPRKKIVKTIGSFARAYPRRPCMLQSAKVISHSGRWG